MTFDEWYNSRDDKRESIAASDYHSFIDYWEGDASTLEILLEGVAYTAWEARYRTLTPRDL
jgi:hypothetical protein